MPCETSDRDAWIARNVLPHEPLIRSRLSKIRGTDVNIEDVIQEMYARLLAVQNVESIRFPKQYALQTAKCIIIDHIRHSQVVSITVTGSLDVLDVVEPSPSAEERLEFRDEIRAVVDVLRTLPSICRQTIMLRRLEGLSQKEVALRLGISEGMVEKYMVRAAKLLVSEFGRGRKVSSQPSDARIRVDAKDVAKKPRD